ncbi:hypothetical protein SAMN05444166_1676 [Singulisphaera sp. GP187]|uniref:GNAT family N-acetyltransferase n=1 Tax=Singulisphaera sp. GP187 TaxID=1882752 RepID=UPI0009272571|nr:hypothetical protein [Singulisphaera sp. GP187]SIN93310.1 hypothetical protein SAMN05444166_1676 [Singulisphaera sp. GP187]
MVIRPYLAGDEAAQARIYNAVAGPLPNFKSATSAEIARRHHGTDSLAASTFYAVEAGEIVGYAVFDRNNGRISYPWCLPGHESAQRPLLETVLNAMKGLGLSQAWAAYRADWTTILDDLRAQAFLSTREMINYVAELSAIPHEPVPPGFSIGSLQRDESAPLLRWLGGMDSPANRAFLEHFFWENPYFSPESLFAVRREADGQVVGVALVVQRDGFADPTKLDSAMPCFRLGAFGVERERHKRVNGLFSCLSDSPEVRTILLGEAVRRLEQAGLNHIAAQASSDQPELVAFYDRMFQRQGSFPILSRRLA